MEKKIWSKIKWLITVLVLLLFSTCAGLLPSLKKEVPLMLTKWQPEGWEAPQMVYEKINSGTLAVIPFAGGNGQDGETIAELFSFDQTINKVFTPIPRTSITAAMRQERKFQLSTGMTDPDSVIALGKELGARYVIAGNITRLGDKNLLVISILNTETLEQIAGDILLYQNIEEIQEKLPIMAQNIARAPRRNSSGLLKLAVVPFTFSGEDEARNVLAQILAINFLRSGKYAVYPRTVSLNQVQQEWKNQLTGDTADENIVKIGAGENPRYALSGAARRLGTTTMFNASIIDLESGAQMKGNSVNYNTLNDGMEIMELLSAKLSDNVITVSSGTEFMQAINFVNRSGEGSYFIILSGNIGSTNGLSSVNFTNNAVKTITIIGGETEYRIRHDSRRYPFITVPQGITLILKNKISIDCSVLPSTSNTIWVAGGTLEMRDGITLYGGGLGYARKYNSFASAIVIRNGGTFLMKGGTIKNFAAVRGGAVDIEYGSFYMSGGEISDNHAIGGSGEKGIGGGVYLWGDLRHDAIFNMSGGIISGNTAKDGYNNVCAYGIKSIFKQTGGIIKN